MTAILLTCTNNLNENTVIHVLLAYRSPLLLSVHNNCVPFLAIRYVSGLPSNGRTAKSSEILKSLAPLEEMSGVPCCALCPKRYSALEVKMGCGGQDKLVGKSGITLDKKRSGVVNCRPFPIL